MKLIVFGASGGTGQEVLKAALGRGHDVTAFVRRPEALDPIGDRSRIVTGDVLDPDLVVTAIGPQQAVVSALGPRLSAPFDTCSTGTRHILSAMLAGNVSRLICVTGAMIGLPASQLGWMYRLLRWLLPPSQRRLLADRRLQEKLILESPLDWTIVRPPRLTSDAARGAYRVGEDLRMGASASIDRADLAAFIVAELDRREFVRRAVTIRY